ncbi:MAG TPA: hypothetical protein VEI57_16715 [Nitrospirota bacterium]|nr:hypothetical protein [Nitrospirota bacterium]
MKKIILLIGLIVVLANIGVTSAAETLRRDGNWWNDQNDNIKFGYLNGLVDGMTLGNEFSMWNFVSDTTKKSCLKEVKYSFRVYADKYTSNITLEQVRDGLSDFYSDYKNRRILVMHAVWLVLNGIAGTPKEELDKMIESHRRNAD